MKKLIVTFFVAALFLVVAAPAHATFKTPQPLIQVCELNSRGTFSWGLRSSIPAGGFAYNGPDSWNVNVKNKWCNDNKPSPSPTASATAEPTVEPSSSPEPSIEPTASPSASVEPSVEPTATPTVVVSTGTSDGRSDGHTESLGCQKPSDNCNTAVGGTALVASDSLWDWVMMLGFAGLVLLTGIALRKLTDRDYKQAKKVLFGR